MDHATRLWILARLACVGAGLLQLSCSSAPPASVARYPSLPAPAPSYWRGDGVSGSSKIVIDLSRQEARFYKGGTHVGNAPISSGTSTHPTPTGSYKVTEKSRDHRSSIYGAYVDEFDRIVVADVDSRKDPKPEGTRYKGADMAYFLRFNGAVGMHAGYLPGYPASHGCVRLPRNMARLFYNNASYGTQVVVTGSARSAARTTPARDGPVYSAPVTTPETGLDSSRRPSNYRDASRYLESYGGGRRSTDQPPARGQTMYLY